jgi:hypothetical protein
MQTNPCAAGHAPAHCGARLAALLVLAACWVSSPASAQAIAGGETTAPAAAATPDPSPAPAPASTAPSDADDAPRSSIAWRWELSTLARRPPTPFASLRGAPAAAATVDYRLWLGGQHTEVGVGLASDSAVSLAFRHRLSDQSRLTLDAPLRSGGEPGRPRQMALDLGLESSPLHGLAKGQLLRAQLSAHSNLSLRLRGGRIGLYLGVRIAGTE